MKENIKLFLMTLSFAVGGAGLFSSCQSDNEPYLGNSNGILVKSPKFNAYSGNHVWGSETRSNGMDGASDDNLWSNYEVPGNITADEREAVKKALAEKVTGNRISEDIVFPWPAYFLQDVVSAVETDTPSKSYTFEAWNKGSNCSPWWPHVEGESDNYEEVTNNGQISHYYQDRTTNPQTRIDKTALMYDMTVGSYDEMKGKQFRWFVNCHENRHWSEYIVVEVDGSYYICFDFACGFKENDVDGNPGRGNTQNDWDYNDWIIKITPGVPANDPDYEVPEVWGKKDTPQHPDGDECEDCGHEVHGDYNCPECKKTTENGDFMGPCIGLVLGDKVPELPSGDATPDENPGHFKHNNEVETNLSISDRNGKYLESHLSIHIRANTDVEVNIPVPAKYYCATDDMAIVEKHFEEMMAHGGPASMSYEINGHTVTLTVEFQAENIRITTSGINEDVINYCQEKYGDGITFEVWNYFNEAISIDELRNYLNQATIRFLNAEPDSYINAFNKDEAGARFEDDCTVDIADDQRSDYNDPVTGSHLNGSPYNEIYEKKKGQ